MYVYNFGPWAAIESAAAMLAFSQVGAYFSGADWLAVSCRSHLTKHALSPPEIAGQMTVRWRGLYPKGQTSEKVVEAADIA